jgi:hypothetical protein
MLKRMSVDMCGEKMKGTFALIMSEEERKETDGI